MSDIQQYILEADRDRVEADAIVQRTATRLATKDLKLLELIESLGEYLNNDDTVIRTRTVAYLADILNALRTGVLSRQQRDLLNDFILTRIENGAEAPGHCARGLLALEALGRFDEGRLHKVLKTVLGTLSPLTQIKKQSERFEILRLFDVLFSKYRKELKDLHEEDGMFVQRLLSCLDGEKDPRNLMIIFSVLNIPMVEWDVSTNAQDLFDAVLNYFPITFRPPPNDPYGITAQDLKDRLRDCISSTGYFAPYAFPALLDKLDSTSANVKRDALQALQACARRYGPSTINLYSITLWDAVKYEILNSQEEDLADEALRVLYEIGRHLSSSTHEGPLQNFLKPICKECNEHLEDAPTKQSSASGRILGAVAESSAESASLIVKAVLPQLLRFCQSADNLPRRRGLFEVLIKIFDAHATVFGHWRLQESRSSQFSDQDAEPDLKSSPTVLNEYSGQAFEILCAAVEQTPLQEVSFRTLALDGLRSLALVRSLFDPALIVRVIQLLDAIIISEASHGRDEVKAKSIDVLVDVARQKPQLVVENAFPAFMAELPDTDTGYQRSYIPILEAFARLSSEPQVFNTIIIRLKNKLYTAIRQNSSAKYTNSILSAILYGFRNLATPTTSPESLVPYYSDLVVPLINDIVASGRTKFPDSPSNTDPSTFDLIGRIANVVLRSQPLAAQTEIARNIYALFRDVEISTLPPFIDGTSQQQLTMLTSNHLLAALRPQLPPHTDLNALLTTLITFASSSTIRETVTTTAIAQISVLINKFIPTSELSSAVKPYIDSFVPDPTTLRITFSILKALILRADPTIRDLLPQLLNHLSSALHGPTAARLFSSLLSPDPLLTKENHCKIYAIHRQRFFSLAAPLLVSGYRNPPSPSSSSTEAPASTEQIKENYLTALTGITSQIPYQILQPQLESLTGPLLQSLTLHDTSVQSSALLTISKIIVNDPKKVESHVSSLISRLLDVAVPAPLLGTGTAVPPKYKHLEPHHEDEKKRKVHSEPRVRAAALACLASFIGSLKDEALIPYQRETVKRLQGALDDSRRVVRAEAVRCRSAWLGLVGEDSEDEY